MVGFEALLRWQHPERGLLKPSAFVPLAEDTDVIAPIGRWVLEEACRQVQAWRLAHPQTSLSVSVNISGRQLQGPGIADALGDALASSGVDPSAVILEITESVLMQQTDAVLERLQVLKKLGVRLAIDDFGTGYSSLSYLQRFPIDILKIAKPFVEEVALGAERAALARAIVGLGDTLRLQTVAEGVEMAEQRAALIELGCPLGQGHYFSRALPAEAIDRILAGRRSLVPPHAHHGAAPKLAVPRDAS
jgi:EAL domain-containing protein (putative c-di-GMP-specific phosphodiesterase class I)